MVARKFREQDNSVHDAGFDPGSETKLLSLSEQGRVLMQGGVDGELVPFAISVFSGAFDVQPPRLILAAPSEGRSEAQGFKLLAPELEEDNSSVLSPVSKRSFVSEPESVTVLIDVSQEGRTVQLFEVEIPLP
jgi:hypothetical protein